MRGHSHNILDNVKERISKNEAQSAVNVSNETQCILYRDVRTCCSVVGCSPTSTETEGKGWVRGAGGRGSCFSGMVG